MHDIVDSIEVDKCSFRRKQFIRFPFADIDTKHEGFIYIYIYMCIYAASVIHDQLATVEAKQHVLWHVFSLWMRINQIFVFSFNLG